MKIQTLTIAGISAISASLLMLDTGPFQSTAFATEDTPVTENAHHVAGDFSVSPQISPADVSIAASNGVTLIINNRPDGEAPGQPKSADIAAAAKAAGIAYVHIPVDRSGISSTHIAAFDHAIAQAGAEGKTLAFCRTGTRSILVRSYSAATAGQPVADILSEATAAGYDLSGHTPTLEGLTPKTHEH